MQPGIHNFSKHLFWDVNRENLDLKKNRAYIIKQVLEYGLMEDWETIFNYYGIRQIAEVAQNFRELDPKALSFISLLSKIPLKEFRCYTLKPSVPPHWNF